MSTTPTQAQALIWPQLLYAMAQVAGRPGDKECCGWIWATAPDADHIKLIATEGAALLSAHIPATHTLGSGAYRIDPAGHTKKPTQGAASRPVLCSLERYGDALPFSSEKVKARLKGGLAKASVDPARAAAFFKAASAICQRVDLTTLGEAVFFQCPHLEFKGDVRGVIANLSFPTNR